MSDESDQDWLDVLDEPEALSIKAPKQKRGFAVLDPTKHRDLSSKGAKAAHAKGAAHRFSSEQAKAAGRKGGLEAAAQNRAAREAMFGKSSAADRTLEMFDPPELRPNPNANGEGTE